MNQYLIPANSKRSMMILGLFEPIDLIIFGIGALITLILMFVINDVETIKSVAIILTPAGIGMVMVLPIPNHRNVWNFTANVYTYFSSQRNYRWRGWCVIDGEEYREASK